MQIPKLQCKNTVNNVQGNMSPPKPSQPITARLEYFNTPETQESNAKTNFITIIDVLKDEINKSCKEVEGKKLKNKENQ